MPARTYSRPSGVTTYRNAGESRLCQCSAGKWCAVFHSCPTAHQPTRGAGLGPRQSRHSCRPPLPGWSESAGDDVLPPERFGDVGQLGRQPVRPTLVSGQASPLAPLRACRGPRVPRRRTSVLLGGVIRPLRYGYLTGRPHGYVGASQQLSGQTVNARHRRRRLALHDAGPTARCKLRRPRRLCGFASSSRGSFNASSNRASATRCKRPSITAGCTLGPCSPSRTEPSRDTAASNAAKTSTVRQASIKRAFSWLSRSKLSTIERQNAAPGPFKPVGRRGFFMGHNLSGDNDVISYVLRTLNCERPSKRSCRGAAPRWWGHPSDHWPLIVSGLGHRPSRLDH